MSDLFGGIDLSGFFAGVLADVIALLNAVVAALGALIQALGQAFGQVGTDLDYIYGFSFDGLTSIFKALKNLLDNVIWGEILKIWTKLLALWKIVADFINKLEQYYKILEKNYRQHVLASLKLYLNIIQRMRAILGPLKLLHVKWASALDLKFLSLEAKLGNAFAQIIAHDNQVLTVLNEIHDPRGLLRPGHTLGSVGTMIGAIGAAVKGLDPRTLLCLPTTGVYPVLSQPWLATSAQLAADISQNTGDYASAHAARDFTLKQFQGDLGAPAGNLWEQDQ